MKTYLNMLQHVLDNGTKRGDRTGTGTTSVFGYQMRYDLQDGFPIVTTKRVWWRGVAEELLWFISGSDNKKELQARGISIWDEWGNDETGDLGPVYGYQWRSWPFIDLGDQVGYGGGDVGVYHAQRLALDQVANVVMSLQHNPESRRHIIATWNASQISEMALPPCHGLVIQFYVREGSYLDCHMYQRSADAFLGVPFNISSYALFTHMMAQVVGLEPGEFIHSFGDLHIYDNHRDQVQEQLSRNPKALPTLRLNPDIDDIDDFTFEDITLEGYTHHPAIKAPVAI